MADLHSARTLAPIHTEPIFDPATLKQLVRKMRRAVRRLQGSFPSKPSR